MKDSIEVFCPKCKMKNLASATVCYYCQSPLPVGKIEERTTKKMSDHKLHIDTDELLKGAVIPKDGLLILSLESGQEIDIVHEEKFILGRAAEGISEFVVDLSAFGAYGLGVSRLHVLVQKTETGYEISDMDSTNGTWLNDQEVLPKRFYPLNSGDTIRMGKMNISVLFIHRKKQDY